MKKTSKIIMGIVGILMLVFSTSPVYGATKFLEPGGDATFGINSIFFSQGGGGTNASVATDFVHGAHVKSIQYAVNSASSVQTGTGMLADAGSRISMYVYFNALPTATATIFKDRESGAVNTWNLRLTSGGVLQMWNGTVAQIGTNGATLTTGRWYRISVAYTMTSTSVNRFEVFVDGVSSISVTNATLANVFGVNLYIGNVDADATLDMRSSDHYIDDSSSLTDTGNVWVTAKRPVSNGSLNQFTTQIGAGSSGYGSGNTPQVNERPLSTTNGWSIQNASTQTEEYTIEGKSAGDIDISTATIVDYMGWVYAKVGSASTGNIILNGSASNISVTTSATLFQKAAGSAVYPTGNTDIGMNTNAINQLFSLYEAGIIVAYIPSASTIKTGDAMRIGMSF